MKRDRALSAALDFLADTICECGHADAEHYTDLSQPYRVAGCAAETCRCREFRPVQFIVARQLK